MKNNTKIGIGVLALAGVGYYFYNKSKSLKSNVITTIPDETKKSGFDREKASKELAVLFFPLINKKDAKQPVKREFFEATGQPVVTGQAVVRDVRTGLVMAEQIRRTPTELSLYKHFLQGLNLILDDSDAEFIVNVYKKYAQAGGDSNFKPDLNTQIRIDKIFEKYPNAKKNLELG